VNRKLAKWLAEDFNRGVSFSSNVGGYYCQLSYMCEGKRVRGCLWYGDNLFEALECALGGGEWDNA